MNVTYSSAHSKDPFHSHCVSHLNNHSLLGSYPLVFVYSGWSLFTCQLKHLIVSYEDGRGVSKVCYGELVLEDESDEACGAVWVLILFGHLQKI